MVRQLGETMTTPKIDALSPQEVEWVQSQVDGAARFVDAYSDTDAGQPLTLEALDRAFAVWLSQDITDNQLVNAAINAVGIAFGEFLVQSAGFEWVIASDEYGTDLAVIALRGRGDVLVYPANFVAKRWERRESNFLAASFASISQQVAQVRSSWK
ncbi:MAG: DUF3806 domain-containing protein [Gemmataceae bacterium]